LNVCGGDTEMSWVVCVYVCVCSCMCVLV